MNPLLLCFDTGPQSGLGHQRRMEALALSLAEEGAEVQLSPLSEPVCAELVVVDSYKFRADDRQMFTSDIIVAVDDLLRNLKVELVVDATPGASKEDHCAAGRVLAGLGYALVDPRLLTVNPRPVDEEVKVILVTTGAADIAGKGAALAESLLDLPDVEVRLVVGDWSSQRVPARVTPVRAASGLSDELADADLVISGGGVTMLEALCLGRPVVAVCLADNQRRYIEGANAAGAAVLAALDNVPAIAAELCRDRRRRINLSRAARGLVDGRGSRRVAEKILALYE